MSLKQLQHYQKTSKINETIKFLPNLLSDTKSVVI